MKNLKFVIMILVCAIMLSLVACNTMENDAKKLAKKAYEIEKVYASLNDRSNLSGSRKSKERKIKEYTDFANKMLEKHGKDKASRKKFNELVNTELKKLKGK